MIAASATLGPRSAKCSMRIGERRAQVLSSAALAVSPRAACSESIRPSAATCAWLQLSADVRPRMSANWRNCVRNAHGPPQPVRWRCQSGHRGLSWQKGRYPPAVFHPFMREQAIRMRANGSGLKRCRKNTRVPRRSPLHSSILRTWTARGRNAPNIFAGHPTITGLRIMPWQRRWRRPVVPSARCCRVLPMRCTLRPAASSTLRPRLCRGASRMAPGRSARSNSRSLGRAFHDFQTRD